MRQRSSNQSVQRPPTIMVWRKQKTRALRCAGKNYGLAGPYFAKRNFAACALAREAALRWTTPDFTALSMAET